MMAAVLLMLLTVSAPSADVKDIFRKGVEVYLKAQKPDDYLKAAGIWESIVTKGVIHEDLFYNIGNAYYRAGRLGPAIYNYRRALMLNPDDRDARYNLKISRKLVQSRYKDKVVSASEKPLWQKMVTWLDYSTLRSVFLALWWILFGLLGALLFVRDEVKRIATATAAGLVGVSSLFFGMLLAGNIYLNTSIRRGIVLPDEIQVREAPRSMARSSFRLHAGHEVEIRHEEGGWVKIGLANGMEGWTRQEDIGRL